MKIFNFLANFNPFKKSEPLAPGFVGSLVESPIDYRTINMAAATDMTVAIPDTYTNPYTLTQKDQKQTPECVAYSGSTIMEFLQKLFGVDLVFDADDLYAECKKIDGIPDFPGTYLKAVMTVLKNTGAKAIGSDGTVRYKIDGYMLVNTDEASIKRALYTYGVALMGHEGSNGGWLFAAVRPPKAGEKTWRHATTGLDYTPQILSRNQNSWGEKWGDKGKFYVPKNYSPFEVWVAWKGNEPKNWAKLLPDPNLKPMHVFTTNIYFGLSGDEVEALQDALVWLGCMTKEQVATGPGIFGNKTLAGVKLFQQRYGLPQTGYFGELSREKMNELLR